MHLYTLKRRLPLTYSLVCNASNYLLHTKVKTVSLNKMFALHAHRRRFCFTYFLTYLLCYVLGKLFTHVHRISMCLVYIAKVLSLSPFDTWLSLREHRQNVLMHLTFLFTYHCMEKLNIVNDKLSMLVSSPLCALTKCNFSELKCWLCLTCLVTHLLSKLFTCMHMHTHNRIALTFALQFS